MSTLAVPSVVVDTEPRTTDGDVGSPDDMAHYARKEEIARAAVEGGRVKALCGVEFMPLRDPSRFPVCPRCDFIRGQLADQPGDPSAN